MNSYALTSRRGPIVMTAVLAGAALMLWSADLYPYGRRAMDAALDYAATFVVIGDDALAEIGDH